MLFNGFSFSESGFSDLNILKIEFWFEVNALVTNESWIDTTKKITNESITALSAADVASSFSEVAFSQIGISDLGLLVTRENWNSIIASTSVESWSNVNTSGTETWSNVTITGTETWQESFN